MASARCPSSLNTGTSLNPNQELVAIFEAPKRSGSTAIDQSKLIELARNALNKTPSNYILAAVTYPERPDAESPSLVRLVFKPQADGSHSPGLLKRVSAD